MDRQGRVLVLHGRGPAVSLERVHALMDRLRSDGMDCVMAPDLQIDEVVPVVLVWTGGEDLPELPGGRTFQWISAVATFQDVPAEAVPEPIRGLPRYLVDTDRGYEDLWILLDSALECLPLVNRYEWPEEKEEQAPGSGPPVVHLGIPPGGFDEEDPLGGPQTGPPSLKSVPPPVDEPDPPRTAYARLDAPDVAVAEEEIQVVVGLAEKQSPGVVGGPMTRPDASIGSYTLTVQLVAEGFRLRDGETWRRELPVTAEAPWPEALFHLTPEPQEQEVRPRSLQAFYTVLGQTMGMAFRPMVVKRSAEEPAEAPELAGAPGVDLAIPTEATAPDLEVRILNPNHDGWLIWTFASRHPELDLPDEPLRMNIGDDPKGFARHLVDDVNAREGMPGIYDLLAGIGVSIADALPDELWSLLRGAAERAEARRTC